MLVLGWSSPAGAAGAARDPRLSAFRSCEELLGFFRGQALAELEERVREGPVSAVEGFDLPAPPPEPAAGEAPEGDTGPADGAAPADRSTTNVQEAGIDEPDVVKTDGRYVFVLSDRRVRAVGVRGGRPRLVGTVGVPDIEDGMLLYRGRLLVFSAGAGRVYPAGVGPARDGGGLITEIDVRNPRAMRVRRTLAFEGNVVDSRLRAGVARLVVSEPARGLALPYVLDEGEDPQVVLAQGRELIARSGPSDWLPSYTLRERGQPRRSGLLVPCEGVLRSRDSTQYDEVVSVLTIDLRRGLAPVDADAVLMPRADVVYASRHGLYLAHETSQDNDAVPANDELTTIHRFDVARRTSTAHSASGVLAGNLIGQFALSEHRGLLRVASTESPYDRTARRIRRVSYVTVLRPQAGRLEPMGRVGNLGRGEEIQGVRFIGDVGYVVTFRRIDPLYTIDLSHPARPRVTGELKLPGYSTYLHPMGRDRLLGVGRDADSSGRELGVQVSLFDVSNPRDPRRLDHARMGTGTTSEAGYDHHAFLYWPPRRLAIIPVQHDSAGETVITEMVGTRIQGGRSLVEAGRVLQGPAEPEIAVRRSIVVGDRLITVSDRGVTATDLDTWQPAGYARFPTPPRESGRG